MKMANTKESIEFEKKIEILRNDLKSFKIDNDKEEYFFIGLLIKKLIPYSEGLSFLRETNQFQSHTEYLNFICKLLLKYKQKDENKVFDKIVKEVLSFDFQEKEFKRILIPMFLGIYSSFKF